MNFINSINKNLIKLPNNNTSPGESIRNEAIDSLRAILVLYVIWHHFFLSFTTSFDLSPVLTKVTNFGYLAPRFFFLISGYLIFIQAHKKPKIEKFNRRLFYLKRCFRILPIWYLTVLTYYLLQRINLSEAVVYGTFLFGFFSFKIFQILHGWSIFVECFFYFIFPWIFKYLLSKIGNILLIIFFSLLAWIWKSNAKDFGVPTDFWFIEFFPLSNLHYFFIGVFCFHCNELGFIKYRFIETVICGLILFLSWQSLGKFNEAVMYLLFLLVLDQRTFLNRFLSILPVKWIGKACFPIYLFHFLFLEYFIQRSYFWTISQRLVPMEGLLLVVFFLLSGIICIFGFIIHKYIEWPFYRLIR